ncbi:MAG: diacylglyceryl transferase [Weeksellaceae bacterium]|nr:diacylglyceryl transferase [Weeksellaceae bacterium]
MFKKLKKRWEIQSNFQLIIILIVFSITGSISAWLAKPVVDYLGLTSDKISLWFLIPLRLILIFPIYSLLLLITGTIFGQFKFFWAFEKKMFSRFIPKNNKIKKI